jgi:hypothetical protein
MPYKIFYPEKFKLMPDAAIDRNQAEFIIAQTHNVLQQHLRWQKTADLEHEVYTGATLIARVREFRRPERA